MRRILITCLTLGFLVAYNSASGAGGGDAEEIIDKAVAAHRGPEGNALKKGYRGKSKGTLVYDGMQLDFIQEMVVQNPDKFREVKEITYQGKKFTTITVFNGTKGWMKVDDKEIKIDKEILDEFKDVGALMSISNGVFEKDPSVKLALIGDVKINDKACVGVKVTWEGKKPVDMYFDKQTGLTSKIERSKRDLVTGKDVVEERLVLEYQNVDGRKYPKKVEVKVDGKKFMEVEVTEARFVEMVDDSEFVKP